MPVEEPSTASEQDRLAEAVVRGLGERAGAGDSAAAIVEPVSRDVPVGRLGHENLMKDNTTSAVGCATGNGTVASSTIG